MNLFIYSLFIMIGNKIFVKAKELKTRNAPRKRKTQLKIKGGTITVKIS